MGTSDLYGSQDPFQRMPKSPRPPNSDGCDEIVRVDLSNYTQVGPIGFLFLLYQYTPMGDYSTENNGHSDVKSNQNNVVLTKNI